MAGQMHQLETLAEAAEAHARQEHGAAIGLDNVAAVDRILHAECRRLDPERLESMAACYGAWLGRIAVRRWNASWVGLFEPSAPRLRKMSLGSAPRKLYRPHFSPPSTDSSRNA